MKINWRINKIRLAIAAMALAAIILGAFGMDCPFGICPVFRSEIRTMTKINSRHLQQYLTEAQHGSIEAQNLVGGLYYDGWYSDGHPDYEEAYFWLSLPSAHAKLKQGDWKYADARARLTTQQQADVQSRLKSWEPIVVPRYPDVAVKDPVIEVMRDIGKHQREY